MMNGILDNKLLDLTKQASEVFEEKMKLAQTSINKLENIDESTKKELHKILEQTKDKDMNPSELINKLNVIIGGTRS